jgi:hypothetical protein
VTGGDALEHLIMAVGPGQNQRATELCATWMRGVLGF